MSTTTMSAGPAPHTLSRARWASRTQFAALGVFGGVWGVHIPSVKQQFELSESGLSMVLLSIACGAVLSLFFAGRVIGQLGARRATMLASAIMGLLLAAILHWPGLAWVLPAGIVFGAAMSLFDVAINADGTALEAASGKAVMGSLHGSFSLGGMAGAALAAAMLRADIAPEWQLAGTALAVVAIVWNAARSMLDAHPPASSDEPEAHFAWPRGTLLVIGLLIFSGMTAEGVMYDWSVLYLKQELAMPQDAAGLGFAVFSAAMAAARFGGDALRARHPEHLLLRNGALLAAVAMAAVLLIGQPWVALAGYACVGVGLALCVPILFNAATRVPGVSRAAAIASVSSIGYSGFLIGPPLIGFVAHHASLTAALGLVVVAAGALALGARRASC
ncbi:MFS transporter [Pelomonas sp. KK5]|uniref:MFS transporter n=1 Tax=Pelomonas sp. KK5 TaxID=1855730 RepID=UPI001E38C430|nr:MFS transporter [Pelomonas sp. KK5]